MLYLSGQPPGSLGRGLSPFPLLLGSPPLRHPPTPLQGPGIPVHDGLPPRVPSYSPKALIHAEVEFNMEFIPERVTLTQGLTPKN